MPVNAAHHFVCLDVVVSCGVDATVTQNPEQYQLYVAADLFKLEKPSCSSILKQIFLSILPVLSYDMHVLATLCPAQLNAAEFLMYIIC